MCICFQMSSTSALSSIRFEIVFYLISFLFEILIQTQKCKLPFAGLLGLPDLAKNPETGNWKAKMTEVKKLKFDKNMKMHFFCHKGASCAGQGDKETGRK